MGIPGVRELVTLGVRELVTPLTVVMSDVSRLVLVEASIVTTTYHRFVVQVLKFLVTSLRGADELTTLESNKEQDEQFQKEFKQYQEKTQRARDE